MMFAYVTCCPDIAYALTTLSKFSVCPTKLHYGYLKGVLKYLCCTKHWGIRFRRSCLSLEFPNLPATFHISFLPYYRQLPTCLLCQRRLCQRPSQTTFNYWLCHHSCWRCCSLQVQDTIMHSSQFHQRRILFCRLSC